MTIHEPWTFATDVVLAALAAAFGGLLLRRTAARAGNRVARLWGWALVATAVGAFAGGLWHALAPQMPAQLARPLWKLSMAAIGVASCGMLLGTAASRLTGPARAALELFARGELAVYLAWCAFHDDFLWVILDYASAMAIVLVLQARALARREGDGAGPIAAGVALSFAAAGVQQSPFALGPLNHNDLYHLLQMAALWLFHRGARATLSAA